MKNIVWLEYHYGRDLSPILNQFIRFASVGAVGTLMHYGALILLVQIMALNAILASTAGFVIGALTNYQLNYHYTFRSDKNHAEAMGKFFTVAIVGMLFNGLAMFFCMDILDMLYLFAQVVATALVLLWNFFANRWWTFRECRKDAN